MTSEPGSECRAAARVGEAGAGGQLILFCREWETSKDLQQRRNKTKTGFGYNSGCSERDVSPEPGPLGEHKYFRNELVILRGKRG